MKYYITVLVHTQEKMYKIRFYAKLLIEIEAQVKSKWPDACIFSMCSKLE